MTSSAENSVRLDAWLWGVRCYKTRSAATAAVRAGHVRLGEQPAKPASSVRIGDTVRVRTEAGERTLRVTGLLRKRVGAVEAAKHYQDLTPPAQPRSMAQEGVVRRDPGAGRPTKRDRRLIERFSGLRRGSH